MSQRDEAQRTFPPDRRELTGCIHHEISLPAPLSIFLLIILLTFNTYKNDFIENLFSFFLDMYLFVVYFNRERIL